jgi:hypothetical protein
MSVYRENQKPEVIVKNIYFNKNNVEFFFCKAVLGFVAGALFYSLFFMDKTAVPDYCYIDNKANTGLKLYQHIPGFHFDRVVAEDRDTESLILAASKLKCELK